METLAERLRHARELRGISQSELARRCNVTPQAIQALESGRAKSTRLITTLAGALAVDDQWLETGIEPMERHLEFSIPESTSGTGDLSEKPRRIVIEHVTGPRAPSAAAKFTADRLPVFFADHVYTPDVESLPEEMIARSRVVDEWTSKIHFDTVRDKADTVNRMRFVSGNIDLPIARPAQLGGIVEAYAIAAENWGHFPRLSGSEVLYVNPFRFPSIGNLVVAWISDTQFFVAEYMEEDEKDVLLALESSLLRAIQIPKSIVIALHVVVGLEYAFGEARHRWASLARRQTMR